MKKLIVICLALALSLVSILGPSISAGTISSSKGKAINGPAFAPVSATTQSLPTAEFPICTDPANQLYPAISGDIVVWRDYRSGNDDIYGYDLSAQTEFPICTEPADQGSPAISGDIVVWQDWRNPVEDNPYYCDIYGYDLPTHTEFPVTSHPATQGHPAISGDIVVWVDYRNGPGAGYDPANTDIYGYELSTQTEFPIVTALADQEDPAISGDILVWRDERNGNGDIYGRQIIRPIVALVVDLLSFSFLSWPVGENPPPQNIDISNAGNAPLDWTATKDADWLNISPSSGTTPSTMSASVDTSALTRGYYTGRITISGTTPGTLNSPQVVEVQLVVDNWVSGTIDVDTTWTVADSPHIVKGDVTASEGVVLTIEPGVEVQFDTSDALSSGQDSDKVELIIGGTLVVDGVTFTSHASEPAAGDWYGIRFLDSSIDYGDSGCIIENSTIEYGTVGISTDGASPLISNNTIADMKGNDGLFYTEYPDCDDVDGEDGYGIYIANDSSPTIISNTISRIFGGAGGSCVPSPPYFWIAGDGGNAVGIYVANTPSPTITGNDISVIEGGSNGGLGAGIYLSASSATIANNNISLVDGGGSTYRGSHDGGFGAGIYIIDGSSLTIDSNIISSINGGNGADGYADPFCRGGNPTGDGGIGAGIYAVGSSSLNIANNVIFETEGGDGGKGYPECMGGPPEGEPPGPGGDGGLGAGVHAEASLVTFMNNTVVASAGGRGGAPGGEGASPGSDGSGVGVDVASTVTITNNIIVSHTIGISGTTTTAPPSYNDVWANSEANYSGVAPGTNGISADPLFVDPANNDYHLQCGSPAIDAGTNEGAPLTDFEGDPRSLDGNSDGIAVVDMGADEFVRPVPPLFGDLDCDCDVDVADIMLVASRWHTAEGDEDYVPFCDLDGNGKIDIVDIMLVAVYWGETCG